MRYFFFLFSLHFTSSHYYYYCCSTSFLFPSYVSHVPLWSSDAHYRPKDDTAIVKHTQHGYVHGAAEEKRPMAAAARVSRQCDRPNAAFFIFIFSLRRCPSACLMAAVRFPLVTVTTAIRWSRTPGPREKAPPSFSDIAAAVSLRSGSNGVSRAVSRRFSVRVDAFLPTPCHVSPMTVPFVRLRVTTTAIIVVLLTPYLSFASVAGQAFCFFSFVVVLCVYVCGVCVLTSLWLIILSKSRTRARAFASVVVNIQVYQRTGVFACARVSVYTSYTH